MSIIAVIDKIWKRKSWRRNRNLGIKKFSDVVMYSTSELTGSLPYSLVCPIVKAEVSFKKYLIKYTFVKCLDFMGIRLYNKTVANTTAVPKSQIII